MQHKPNRVRWWQLPPALVVRLILKGASPLTAEESAVLLAAVLSETSEPTEATVVEE